MKKLFYTIFAFIPFLILIFVIPSSASAYIDEGVVVWASGGRVMARVYSDVDGSLGTPFVAISGINAKFVNLKSSPLKKEFTLGVQDTSGVLRVYTSTDGISWTLGFTITIGDGNVPRFDIAYEQVSGRALVAYRGRILTLRTTFYYRIWSGTSWGLQVEMRSTYAAYTGNIVNMKIASRPNSNQIGLVYNDDKYYAVAAFWSGTAWTFAPSAVTTNSSRYNGYAGVFPPLSNTSVSFESQSGDMLVVAGQNDADRIHYLTRSLAGTWSAVSVFNTVTGYGDYSTLKPSPTTNEISFTACMMEPNGTNGAVYLCDFVLWNGSGFGSVVSDSVVGQIVDGDTPIDSFWITDGGNRAVVAVYDDNNTNGLDWHLSLNGGSFSPQTSEGGAPTINIHEGQIITSNIEGSPNSALVVVSDENRAIYMKRATLTGTTVSWNSVSPGSLAEITQGANLVDSSNYSRVGIALQTNQSLLTISTTSANTRKRIPSGTTSYIASSNCTGPTDCSGFVLSARGPSSITVSSITLTDSGIIYLWETSNWELGVDSDGNPNNGVTRTVSGTVSGNDITFNFSPSLTIQNGEKVYLFPRATFGASSYPYSGDTIDLSLTSINNINSSASPINEELILGTPTVYGVIIPNIISYTNNTESSLSNSGSACTNCGGRIGAGTDGHNITINGMGFGYSEGSIVINGVSTTSIAYLNVDSWSNEQITFNLNTSTAGNTDADFGLNYGGVGGLSIITDGRESNALDFNLFPQILLLVTSSSTGADAAKEYSSVDTDGVITIVGTRLGSTASTSKVLILGCSNTTCTSPGDSAYINSWSNTAVSVRVPASIPDNIYTGNITLTRSFPNSLASTVGYKNQLTIRPRVTSITPTEGSSDTDIVISGNHLCPASGVCPTGSVGVDNNLTLSPAFSSSDRVSIGGINSNYFNTWSHSQIETKVPIVVTTGPTTAVVTAGTYNAGSVPFNITAVSIPIAPNSLDQYLGTSTITKIPVGQAASNGQITFGSIIGAYVSGVSTMRMDVEAVPIGSAFVCGSGSCATVKAGPWVASKDSLDCRIAVNGCSVSTSLGDNAYHWRARTELVYLGTTYYSAWINYPDTAPNLESDTDFWVDSTGPVILNLSHGTPGTNGVTISWDTNEKTDSLVEINKTGVFTDNCIAADGCTGSSASLTLSKSIVIKNLSANTTYYYRVRGRDSAGNVAWSSIQQFKTLAISKPAKTLLYHVISRGGILAENASTTSTFTINIPEVSPEFQSIFIDVRGMYSTSGIEPKAGLTIGVNGEAESTYLFPGGSNIVSSWRLYHKVKALNLLPGTNTIKFKAASDTQISGISADAVVSYLYVP